MTGEVFDFPPPTAERPKENGYFWIKLATDVIRPSSDNVDTRQWISTGWSLIFHDATRTADKCVLIIGSEERWPWSERGPIDDWIIYEVGTKLELPPEN